MRYINCNKEIILCNRDDFEKWISICGKYCDDFIILKMENPHKRYYYGNPTSKDQLHKICGVINGELQDNCLIIYDDHHSLERQLIILNDAIDYWKHCPKQNINEEIPASEILYKEFKRMCCSCYEPRPIVHTPSFATIP